MKYLNCKSVSTIALIASLVATGSQASNIPDDNYLRNIGLSNLHVTYGHPQYKPNAVAARKVLGVLGLPQVLDSDSPKTGGYGEVYMAADVVVKVSLPDLSWKTPSTESNRLLTLKRDMGENPVPGVNLRLAWPKVIYSTYAEGDWWSKPNLGTYPYHIHVAQRIRPVKEMRDVTEDVLIHNRQAAQADIHAFGHALGKMQNSTLRHRWGDHYVSLAHMDLNPQNILPTGLPSLGQAFAITLIDLADVRKGTDADAPELPTDVVYHLLRTWDYARTSSNYKVLPTAQKQVNVQTYFINFFTGYLSAFPSHVRTALKPVYTTRVAYDRYLADKLYDVIGPMSAYGESYEKWVLPAVAAAFQFHEVPSVVAPKFPYQMLMTFNAAGYQQLYPTACKDAALFQMDANTVAKFHYVTWGRDAGYYFPDRPVTVPAGFNSQAYLEMYGHVRDEARTYKMDGENYAKLHYMMWGQALKYVFLTQPITVPAGFNENAYRIMYPDVDPAAAAFKVTDLNVFARVHYCLFGSKTPHAKVPNRLVVTRSWDILPWDWNTDIYLAKWPHLKDEAERFGIDLRTYAMVQYVQFGSQCGQAYK